MELLRFFTDKSCGDFFNIIIFWVININFDLSQGVKDFLASVVNEILERTIKLRDGNGHSLISLSTNQIHDSFSLSQVHTTIQKGTFGKFSRFSHTSSRTNKELEDFISHSNPTVSVDLHDILTRKGLWRTHNTYHDFINGFLIFDNMAVIDSM